MRRAGAARRVAAATLLALGVGGCAEKRLAFVSVQPPAGSTAEGVTADPIGPSRDAGRPIYRFEVAEGDEVRFGVTVRNVSADRVEVLDAIQDPERNGGFRVDSVTGAPVPIEPGAQATVEVSGRIVACRYDGQLLSLADPELVLRLPDGETEKEFVVTGTELEYAAPKREDC